MSDTRIIKRYANRKLYDTQHSRYVTLEQISEMIRDGDDVKIIDNKTKEDLTSVTLAQIIFEEEKKQRSFLSLQTMRQLIQNGGESFASLVTEAQRRVTSILPRRVDGEERMGDGQHEGIEDEGETSEAKKLEANKLEANKLEANKPEAKRPEAKRPEAKRPEAKRPEDGHEGMEQTSTAVGKRGREALASLREFREWIQQTQHTVEEWQKRVDHRIRDMVGGISPLSGIHKDVTGLATRIAELEAKLARLSSQPETAHELEGAAGATEGAAREGAVASHVPSEDAGASSSEQDLEA